MPKPKRWSYSAWSLHKECPARYRYKYIEKLPEGPPHPAMARGTEIHALAESTLLGKIRGVPRALRHFADEFKALRKLKPQVEQWWRVDRKWRASSEESEWCVGRTDAFAMHDDTLLVVDHKTGKVYDSHAEQASLYAALGAAQFPAMENVDVEFWYLDANKVGAYRYTRDQLDALSGLWRERGQQLMTAKQYPATPGWQCKWCPYRSSEGGPCAAWKKT